MAPKYAIMRIEKLHSHFQISQAVAHNYRLIPVPHAFNKSRVQEIHGSVNAPIQAKKILESVKVRKNAVYAFEVVLTASPSYFREDPDAFGTYDFNAYEDFESKAVSWLNDTFGESNIISSVGHLDEATPHVQALIIPIDPKGKLNARHFTGGSEKLRAMQDSWADYCKPLGLVRGLPNDVPRQHVPISEFHQAKSYAEKALLMARHSIDRLLPMDGLATRKNRP
jgi:hypothetical protein